MKLFLKRRPLSGDSLVQHFLLSVLLLFILSGHATTAQTVYTVVLGNQDYVVGSSTLKSGLFVSYDGAQSWKHVGPKNLKAYSMDAVDSSNGRVLYIAAGNGVHRSTDYGTSWKIVTDWRMTEVLDIKVDQASPNHVYAATAFGFWRSTDGGDTWENPEGPAQKGYWYQIMLDSAQNTVALVAGEKRQHTSLVSFDHGTSWMPLDLASLGAWSDAYDIIWLPITQDASIVCYADSTGIHVGPDRISMTTNIVANKAFSELPSTMPAPSTHHVHALNLVTSTDDVVLIAGTFGDGLYKWDGKDWSFTGLAGSQVWRIITKEYTVPVEVGDAD